MGIDFSGLNDDMSHPAPTAKNYKSHQIVRTPQVELSPHVLQTIQNTINTQNPEALLTQDLKQALIDHQKKMFKDVLGINNPSINGSSISIRQIDGTNVYHISVPGNGSKGPLKTKTYHSTGNFYLQIDASKNPTSIGFLTGSTLLDGTHPVSPNRLNQMPQGYYVYNTDPLHEDSDLFFDNMGLLAAPKVYAEKYQMLAMGTPVNEQSHDIAQEHFSFHLDDFLYNIQKKSLNQWSQEVGITLPVITPELSSDSANAVTKDIRRSAMAISKENLKTLNIANAEQLLLSMNRWIVDPHQLKKIQASLLAILDQANASLKDIDQTFVMGQGVELGKILQMTTSGSMFRLVRLDSEKIVLQKIAPGAIKEIVNENHQKIIDFSCEDEYTIDLKKETIDFSSKVLLIPEKNVTEETRALQEKLLDHFQTQRKFSVGHYETMLVHGSPGSVGHYETMLVHGSPGMARSMLAQTWRGQRFTLDPIPFPIADSEVPLCGWNGDQEKQTLSSQDFKSFIGDNPNASYKHPFGPNVPDVDAELLGRLHQLKIQQIKELYGQAKNWATGDNLIYEAQAYAHRINPDDMHVTFLVKIKQGDSVIGMLTSEHVGYMDDTGKPQVDLIEYYAFSDPAHDSLDPRNLSQHTQDIEPISPVKHHPLNHIRLDFLAKDIEEAVQNNQNPVEENTLSTEQDDVFIASGFFDSNNEDEAFPLAPSTMTSSPSSPLSSSSLVSNFGTLNNPPNSMTQNSLKDEDVHSPSSLFEKEDLPEELPATRLRSGAHSASSSNSSG